MAVVALLAGLLGALIGSGISALVLRPSQAPVAAPVSPSAQVLTPTVRTPEEGPRDRVAVVAAAVLPAVVQVDISGGDDLGEEGLAGNGSGVIYRSDGYIVTNNHVVSEADDIEVRFADGNVTRAVVVGTDPINDLAVIKVDAADLPAIQVTRSSEVEIGELAIAVGSPFGLAGSVTAGIVSGLDRPLDIMSPDGQQLHLVDVIQTDAPINPGNSGGALVGADGRLIGINSAIFTAGQPANAGVGFAISADTVVRVADELIANGFVRHAFLGVEGKTIDREDGQRLDVERGARIESVQPGTPAEAAGLRRDDVIIRAAGVTVTSMDDLIAALRERAVGERVSITFVRDGAERTVEVILGERPPN